MTKLKISDLKKGIRFTKNEEKGIFVKEKLGRENDSAHYREDQPDLIRYFGTIRQVL